MNFPQTVEDIGDNVFKNIPKNVTIKAPKKQKKSYTKMLKKAGFKVKVIRDRI